MNVYAIRGAGNYCEGICVVAATSEDEAIQLSQSHRCSRFQTWPVDFQKSPVHQNEILADLKCEGQPRVIMAFASGE